LIRSKGRFHYRTCRGDRGNPLRAADLLLEGIEQLRAFVLHVADSSLSGPLTRHARSRTSSAQSRRELVFRMGWHRSILAVALVLVSTCWLPAIAVRIDWISCAVLNGLRTRQRSRWRGGATSSECALKKVIGTPRSTRASAKETGTIRRRYRLVRRTASYSRNIPAAR
jgi:hypothetical protein